MNSATISACGQYRYVLTRRIPSVLRWVNPCLFIMLNPSTADATNNDPTIRRCIGFAESEGCTSLTVVNLFALRATDPSELTRHRDPVGPDNDRHIEAQVRDHQNGLIIAAWGANNFAEHRARMLMDTLGPNPRIQALATTKLGWPRHPLYLRADLRPQDWTCP